MERPRILLLCASVLSAWVPVGIVGLLPVQLWLSILLLMIAQLLASAVLKRDELGIVSWLPPVFLLLGILVGIVLLFQLLQQHNAQYAPGLFRAYGELLSILLGTAGFLLAAGLGLFAALAVPLRFTPLITVLAVANTIGSLATLVLVGYVKLGF